ncbi:MAG TPA: phosphoribosylformylglycinamidine synthase subunit PurL [Gammaproteobacteria bacterium]|nr:phosphoribosylformylglycinamidine synthase subunit PurL [Gammaproteobacteria bacterium]
MQAIPELFDFSKLSREAITALLQQYRLSLTVDEALTIQNTLLKRPPTFAECVLWSIQGSEHCSYKSSRKHLRQFKTEAPHVILGAKEDAGIVAVATDNQGKRYGVVVSHESHNHPSQIVPYEGAATGVGGNVRDVCCMGAEVIAVADSLRFGDIQRAKTHWIHEGVIGGIAGYGNPLGIANLAGDLYYDPAYNENCLVTVVTLGIVREDHVIHSYAPANAENYVFILVGKPTDNSGFGGASFASSTLDVAQQEQNKGAVQEPNAFLQRHILKANYALFKLLREQQLIDKVGFKDLGAGGIACASVELAEAGGYGAEIELDQVPTGMAGLLPAVVLCSETQERFMWVVPPELAELVLRHYNETFALPQVSAGACAAIVGKVRADDLFVVKASGKTIVHAKAADVTKGIVYDRPYHAPVTQTLMEPHLTMPADMNVVLLDLLAHENIASRAPIVEMYDKQVQGRTRIEAGYADAGVMQPFNDDIYPEEIRQTGIALSLDHNPRYNKIDPYWGAVNAVVESVRNVVAVGAMPVALTDCLCFGNPEKPEQMYEFVESVRGIAEACRAVSVLPAAAPVFNDSNMSAITPTTLPVIAGNVSLYNESAQGAIPPSPMISCLGVLPDVRKAITYHLKRSETMLFLVGERKDECGGSVYYQIAEVAALGCNVPKPDLAHFDHEIQAVQAAIQQGLILAAHDISEGGVAVALAEMSFANQIGVKVQIPGELPVEKRLFGETGGFVLEVARDKAKMVRELFTKYAVPLITLGETTLAPILSMNDVIALPVRDAQLAWENGLRDKLL